MTSQTCSLALVVSHLRMASLDTASDIALCHHERDTA